MKLSRFISEFEFSFTTSFKHTAQVKYQVEFAKSSVDHTQEQLHKLKDNVIKGIKTQVHTGYDFGLEEVERVIILLDKIIEGYREMYGVTPPPERKIYHLFDQIRRSEMESPHDIAKSVVTEILAPPTPKNQSKAEKIKAEAKALSQKRALNRMKKR